MTDGTVWVEVLEDSEDELTFPNKDMFELGHFIGEIILGIVPDARIDISVSQSRAGMVFQFRFENTDNLALFIGPKFRVVNAILEVVRFQQLVKHDRYIVFEIVKPDGGVQKITNKRTFAGNPNLAEKVQAKLNRVLNTRSRESQLKSLEQIVEYIESLEV